VDLFLDLAVTAGDLTLGVAGEWAGVRGRTEVPRTVGYPGGVDIAASALVTRASLAHKWFNVVFEVGRAGGDANPFDGSYNSFVMNPDYQVGLLLFPEVIRDTTAVTAFNLADPRYSGQPVRGFRAIPSDGGVVNAVYAFPRVTGTFVPHLDVEAGLVVARAEVPWVDPFQSGVRGGAAVGPRGGKASTNLGWEADAALRTRWQLGPIGLLGAVEYAYFQPGRVFADASGATPDPVHLVQGRLHVTW